jgi:hypothetical protein
MNRMKNQGMFRIPEVSNAFQYYNYTGTKPRWQFAIDMIEKSSAELQIY